MKRLMFIACALLAFSCAQNPAELPAPDQNAVGTRGITQLQPGTIIGTQGLIPGWQPGLWAFSGSPATGGDSSVPYAYEWEYKDGYNGYWRSTGATVETDYLPTAPMQTTYYRRKVTSGFQTAYSNEIALGVTEKPVLQRNTSTTNHAYLQVTNPVFNDSDLTNKFDVIYVWESDGIDEAHYPVWNPWCYYAPGFGKTSVKVRCQARYLGHYSEWSEWFIADIY